MKLDDPVQFVKGVGPRRSEMLAKSGIETVEDLLYHLPFRYEDRRRVIAADEVCAGQDATLVGRISGVRQRPLRGRGRAMLEARFEDDAGSLSLVWFHQAAYFKKKLETAERWLLYGRVERARRGGLQLVHPEIEAVGDEVGEAARILPVYQKPTDLPVAAMRRIVGSAVEGAVALARSAVPETVRRRLGLLEPNRALLDVHMPGRESDPEALLRFATQGHRSLIFEELFALQVGMRLRKRWRAKERGVVIAEGEQKVIEFLAALPFEPTGAQSRSSREIAADLTGTAPMNRLLHGDVGSGKTLVAFSAVVRAAASSYQSAVMAPTELLAEQHYETMRPWAESLGISIALLTGNVPAAEAAAIRTGLAAGEIDLAIGTHALVQDSTSFRRLGLAVVDEQHRFGVMQRAALGAGEVNTLLLSATPIPRTLSLAIYGDVEVSLLDEMPPGRLPIVTKVLDGTSRERLYDRMAAAMSEGRRCYIVYPLVEESEKVDLADATSMAEQLKKGPFKDFRVELLHGRMSAAEKDTVMRSFKAGGVDCLVATTVIEVGIDVPEATIMVVEHAERFGLAQLHQLRGRVGRGGIESFCCLVAGPERGPDAMERLRTLERTGDGFEVAEADLRIRGPGEYLGTRQSGLPAFRAANLVRDGELLELARVEAENWLAGDADLSGPDSAVLRLALERRWGDKLGLAEVG